MPSSSIDPSQQPEESRVSLDHTGDNYGVSTFYDNALPSTENGVGSILSGCFGSLLKPCLGNRKKKVERPAKTDYQNLERAGRDDDDFELSGLEPSNASKFTLFDSALAKAGKDPSYDDPEDGEAVIRAYQGGLEATSSAKRHSNGARPDQTTPQADNRVPQPGSMSEQD